MAPLHILPMNSLPGFFPGRMAVSRQHTPRLRIVRKTTVFLTPRCVADRDNVLDANVAIGDIYWMKLIFSPAAAKALTKIPRNEGIGLLAKLQQVVANPMGQYPWAKRLTDQPGFRVRQGDWRAVYRLDYDAGVMIVDKIAKRDEVYR